LNSLSGFYFSNPETVVAFVAPKLPNCLLTGVYEPIRLVYDKGSGVRCPVRPSLQQAITEIKDFLNKQGVLNVASEEIARRLREEDHEADDYRVRLLEERLARIFQIDPSISSATLAMTLCRLFMKPIFARGRWYDDALPVVNELRARGFKTGIVSNTSWGSPALLWREEIERLGLAEQMDAVVFCRDVGWRKPARQIFQFALKQINMKARDCVFVGDHPEWDLIGARTVGLDAVLIDRQGILSDDKAQHIRSLYELPARLHGAAKAR
jgi:putative hydrolase of the HAD superfamily